jgi:proteasome lid subunit RPN8/RPN11
MITLQRSHRQQIFAYARESSPQECCGLIGGNSGRTKTIYPLRNCSKNPETEYEAAPEDLFQAQRNMRERGEQLLAIYHSHPRSPDPQPSETDVKQAFYPSAIYLIIGLGGQQPALRAFRISEREQRWEQVEYEIVD